MTTVYTRRGEAGPGGPAQPGGAAPQNLLHYHGNRLAAGSSDLHYHRNVARRRTAGERHVDLDDARKDRKSTRLNSSHLGISYAVFCLKKKKEYGSKLCTGTRHAPGATPSEA